MNELIATVRALSHEGRGIATVEGKTVFIEGALPGETVIFRYEKRRKRFDEAKTVAVLTPSVDRVVPRCIHFGHCGGCALQHIDPTVQIQFKQTVVLENLRHFGGVTPEKVLPAIVGPTYAYRQRARFGVQTVVHSGTVLLGFREKNHRDLVPITQCEVLPPVAAKLLGAFQQQIASLNAYQRIFQLDVLVDEHQCAVVFHAREALRLGDTAALRAFGVEHALSIYVQIEGETLAVSLNPDEVGPTLGYSLPDFDIHLQYRPSDFTQVNFEVNRKLVHSAIELLDLKSTDRVLDLL